MAYWNYKTVKGKKYVFVYRRVDGKQVQVPRSEYSHLDGAPEPNIDAWVAQWTEQYEGKKAQAANILFSDDKLNSYLDDYTEYLRTVKKRARGTRDKYKSLLRRYAFPFFLENGLKDPQQWPGISIKLFPYLKDGDPKSDPPRPKCGQAVIHEVNNALRSFYSWLQDEGIVAYQGSLRLRNFPKETKATPLPRAIKPETVLAFVKAQSDVRIKFMALAGFFFSLRPQETFALRPADFRAGPAVDSLECTAAMRSAGLYDRLAVHITRQQDAYGEPQIPKAYSVGWVSCFNKEAATLLIEILNEIDNVDRQILGRDNRALYDLWKTAADIWEKEFEIEVDGKKKKEMRSLRGITLKSLRRASSYWLGHHTSLSEFQCQKHNRHKDLETTQQYMRRPVEMLDEKPKAGKFNLAG